MTDSIRAVYEHGLLRPLDPVNLAEGQEVQLTILSERDQIRAVLVDILVPQTFDALDDDDLDEDALLAEMDADTQGTSRRFQT